ncbi:MAG: biopolymer transporter ExbD, partial [Candidatus Goldbacteria bacterium]|nr:biopolymer transporter ExbD [Candidatus Goldiibacteriota bacterium]
IMERVHMHGGSSRQEGEGITNINVVPLIDICLVLLIIFMVTSPMVIQSGILVNSSTVTASHGKSTRNEAVQVKLTKKSIFINNNKVEAEQFPAAIKAALDNNKKKLVMITCDRDVQHGRLVSVLDISKMQGAKTLAIMREAKKEK